jgi:hypothetical protein
MVVFIKVYLPLCKGNLAIAYMHIRSCAVCTRAIIITGMLWGLDTVLSEIPFKKIPCAQCLQHISIYGQSSSRRKATTNLDSFM